MLGKMHQGKSISGAQCHWGIREMHKFQFEVNRTVALFLLLLHMLKVGHKWHG